MADVTIRRAEQGDLPALLDIYNHYVRTTPITFDIEPRTLAQRAGWFEQFKSTGPYQCFVAARGANAIGWSCSTRWKERAAYDTSIETTVYLVAGEQGRGLGRKLYEALFAALPNSLHRAYAGITQPNDASNAIHRAFGFELIGTQHEVGRKFGKFWDVALYQKKLK